MYNILFLDFHVLQTIDTIELQKSYGTMREVFGLKANSSMCLWLSDITASDLHGTEHRYKKPEALRSLVTHENSRLCSPVARTSSFSIDCSEAVARRGEEWIRLMQCGEDV